jgi:hypothetical protein
VSLSAGLKAKIGGGGWTRIMKGDLRVFQALANRAYGLPRQELGFAQEKPFKLVIE